MLYFLLLTAFTVSIDSFVCGVGLSLGGGKKSTILCGVCITVLTMCVITNYSARFLADIISEKTASLGGIILIALGFYNMLTKEKNNPLITITDKQNKNTIKDAILTGFAVGLDGSLGNLSLSLMGINELYVPLLITLMHVALIYFGITLSTCKIFSKIKWIDSLAPMVLICLGIYKLCGLFL